MADENEHEALTVDVTTSEDEALLDAAPARERMSAVRELRLAGFPRLLDDPIAILTGALALQAGLHGFDAIYEFLASPVVDAERTGRSLLDHAYHASFYVFALAIPVGCFFWMRWLDWSVKNRLVASEGRFGRTPGGVVWAYFIPLTNLFKPLLDLQRLWRAESRFGGEAPAVLIAWWAMTLAHLATMVAAFLISGTGILTPVSSVIGMLSNLLAIVVIGAFKPVQYRAETRSGIAATEGAPA